MKLDIEPEENPIEKVSSNDSLINDFSQDGRFRIEINLGSALPVFARMPKGDKKKMAFGTSVQTVDDSDIYHSLVIQTQSDKGPLVSKDYEVLVALCALLWEQMFAAKRFELGDSKPQGGYKVYFRYVDICDMLGMPKNSAIAIRNSIKKIKSQSLFIKNFVYDLKSSQFKKRDEETRLVHKITKTYAGNLDADESEYGHGICIHFDPFIIESLLRENITTLSREVFLKIKSGPARRIYSYLASKRILIGKDVFIFRLSELTKLIGMDVNRDVRYKIVNYLKAIKEADSGIEFWDTKRPNENDWDIRIDFNKEKHMVAYINQFYRELEYIYSKDFLLSMCLDHVSVEYLIEEFDRIAKSNNQTTYIFRRRTLNISKFIIDITLFQLKTGQYNLTKSFKALAKALLLKAFKEELEIPDGYTNFVDERFKEKEELKRKLELEKHRQLEEERRVEENKRLYNAFSKIYSSIINNKKMNQRLKKKAEKSLIEDGWDLNNPAYNLQLKQRMEDLAYSDYMGDRQMFDDLFNGVDLLS